MSLPLHSRVVDSPTLDEKESICLSQSKVSSNKDRQGVSLFSAKRLLIFLCLFIVLAISQMPHRSFDRTKATQTVYLRGEHGSIIKPAKVAFATILTHDKAHDDDAISQDLYFVSTRTLCYQILHAEETRNRLGAPCVVLTTPGVRQDKIDRLRQDGATVVQVSSIESSWAQTKIGTWVEMFSKLHLFQLTDYDLVLFMDNDVVLNAPLDGIFNDPAVYVHPSKRNPVEDIAGAEATPKEYLFAGLAELKRHHAYPPSVENSDFPNISYLNGGFFVFMPSATMFEYHMSVLEIPDSFNAALMEQNLWNHLYRPKGNMPWSRMDPTWNIHYPSLQDVQKGAVSVHDKFWFPHDKDLKETLLSWRWRMHGFYEARNYY